MSNPSTAEAPLADRDLEKRFRGLHFEAGHLPEWLARSDLFWNLPSKLRRLVLGGFSPGSLRTIHRLRTRLFDDPNRASLKPFLETRSIFVHIPKTAGISVSQSLYGRKTGDHRTMADYELCFNRVEVESFFKFAFVRNPWDRLLSAYLYLKQGGRNDQDRAWSQRHLSAYDRFQDFVSGWVAEENIGTALHFRPQHEFLHAKRTGLKVDFIGYYEDLAQDYERVRRRLGTGSELAGLNKTAKKSADYREYYDEKSKAIVARVYREDIRLFGYGFDSWQKQTLNPNCGDAVGTPA